MILNMYSLICYWFCFVVLLFLIIIFSMLEIVHSYPNECISFIHVFSPPSLIWITFIILVMIKNILYFRISIVVPSICCSFTYMHFSFIKRYLNLFNLKNNILRKLDDHGHFWITDILISFNWRVLKIFEFLKLEYFISFITK